MLKQFLVTRKRLWSASMQIRTVCRISAKYLTFVAVDLRLEMLVQCLPRQL